MDTKDIYLKKGEAIIGLLAIRTKGPRTVTAIGSDGVERQETLDFDEIEMWANEYDSNFKMITRYKFSLLDFNLEKEVKHFEDGGWVRFERHVEEVL